MKRLITIVLLFCSFFLWTNGTYAREAYTQATDTLEAYTQGVDTQVGVRPVFPENQRNSDVGFFDLVLERGEKQIIELEISNASQEEAVLVFLKAATATTDSGGVVHYTPRRQARQRDETLPFAFEELATLPSYLELEPGEIKVVEITIQMPDVPFDGLIAGGLEISPEIDLEAARAQAGMIINLFNFELPVILRQNENAIEPDLQILGITASQWNLRNMIAVHLQNPEMMFINLMEIHAYVKDGETHEVLHEVHRSELQMAPNSNFYFNIPLEGEMFVPGDYILHMTVASKNGDWSFKEDFRIDSNLAEFLNAQAVIEERDVGGFRRGALMLILGSMALVVVLLFMLRRITKKQAKLKVQQEVAVKELLDKMTEG